MVTMVPYEYGHLGYQVEPPYYLYSHERWSNDLKMLARRWLSSFFPF